MSDARPAVLVAGAINTDLVATVERAPDAGETVTGRAFAIWGGGKAANQAVAAQRAGAATALLGAVGSDDFGAARLRDLQAEGIDTSHIAVRPDATSGVALIVVESGGENRIAYVPGATATVTTGEALSALHRTEPKALLCTLELPIETLATLFRTAQERSTQTLLCASPEPERAHDLLPFVDILVVNQGEAATLLGTAPDNLDSDDLPRRLRALGPPTVVLTLGKRGVIALVEDRLIHEPAIEVNVVDTTGAGDAFAGALTAALSADQPMTTALRCGVAAGGLAASREGAQPSMPTGREIDAALSQDDQWQTTRR